MNSTNTQRSMPRIAAITGRRLPCVLAILMLKAVLPIGAQPLAPEEASANSSASTSTPEAPKPVANETSRPAPTLMQAMKQEQQMAATSLRPFHVPLPHSHSPFAPYMPSMPPPLDLANSPRLQDLTRDGKLYVSLRDAIALAIENNLDLAYFRYN